MGYKRPRQQLHCKRWPRTPCHWGNLSDCSPVKGTYKGTAKQTLEFGVPVSFEDTDVSKDFLAVITPQKSKGYFKRGRWRCSLLPKTYGNGAAAAIDLAAVIKTQLSANYIPYHLYCG